MSAKNGDKSRFQVNRKRAVLRRTKTRELVKALKARDRRQARSRRTRATPQACTPGASCPVRSTYSTYEPR